MVLLFWSRRRLGGRSQSRVGGGRAWPRREHGGVGMLRCVRTDACGRRMEKRGEDREMGSTNKHSLKTWRQHTWTTILGMVLVMSLVDGLLHRGRELQ
jgi:hypothetical protein